MSIGGWAASGRKAMGRTGTIAKKVMKRSAIGGGLAAGGLTAGYMMSRGSSGRNGVNSQNQSW